MEYQKGPLLINQMVSRDCRISALQQPFDRSADDLDPLNPLCPGNMQDEEMLGAYLDKEISGEEKNFDLEKPNLVSLVLIFSRGEK